MEAQKPRGSRNRNADTPPQWRRNSRSGRRSTKHRRSEQARSDRKNLLRTTHHSQGGPTRRAIDEQNPASRKRRHRRRRPQFGNSFRERAHTLPQVTRAPNHRRRRAGAAGRSASSRPPLRVWRRELRARCAVRRCAAPRGPPTGWRTHDNRAAPCGVRTTTHDAAHTSSTARLGHAHAPPHTGAQHAAAMPAHTTTTLERTATSPSHKPVTSPH